MNISKYITYAEATKSDTAIKFNIKNDPDANQLIAMKNVATKVFDPVREFVGAPLGVTSFFRSKDLNTKIGGSSTTSQHMSGEAIDIDCDKYGNSTNKQIFDFIRKNLDFDQLIWEYGTDTNPDWVHVSYKLNGKNRKQVLQKTIKAYLPFNLY